MVLAENDGEGELHKQSHTNKIRPIGGDNCRGAGCNEVPKRGGGLQRRPRQQRQPVAEVQPAVGGGVTGPEQRQYWKEHSHSEVEKCSDEIRP